ncbi:unnamed protein product [Adineta ricciae]|uniref:Uncharacterized protein n=1 Tax=Adineta ricciae TaxID=249248 RepID=A0A815G7Z7_ADIRI|nr:unnamed protein product [Adineta ricciae]
MYGHRQSSSQNGSMYLVKSNAARRWQQVGAVVAGDEQGHSGSGPNELNTPSDIVIDSKNQYFYVADYENSRIQRFPVNGNGDRTGVTFYKFENSTETNPWRPYDKANKPSAIFIDRNDNIYVAEVYCPCRVLKITPGGQVTTLMDAKSGIIQSCSGIFVDKDDNIYISDWIQSTVFKFDRNGKNKQVVAGGNGYGSAPNQLYHPMGIYVAEKSGNLYVADFVNQCVRRWAPGSKQGVIVAGGNDIGTNLNQFNYPSAVIVDNDEKEVYVCDSINARIVRWTIGIKSGEIIIGADNLTKDPRHMCRAMGFKFDRDGNIYVADNYGNRVRKFLVDN